MRLIALPELLLILPVALFLVPAIFYLLTLQRALSICTPENRTLSPARVWLLLLPLFNIIWHFVVVVNVSRTFRNEFRQRGLGNAPHLTVSLGLATCILSVLAFVRSGADVAALGALIC